ncbi:trehalose-phosphatase [Ochrobactrum sp. MYb379]|uniref:trehalose-phosphatase n=1 Tax=Ochrobactrum sp. MYb379 TaxID=2745275 RepID=UPI0030B5BC90
MDLREYCFFFDLDGTLLDLAPTPDAVSVEGGLQAALQKMAEQTDGAVAIVSGRSIEFIDRLLPGHSLAVAGLHGAEVRSHGYTATFTGNASSAFKKARETARQSANAIDDLVFEDKGRAFAIHYRQAPHHEPLVGQLMSDAIRIAGPEFELQSGKFVIEIKPSASNKGTAVETLMTMHPFKGRRPVAAGDDHTDEAMFRAVNRLNGVSLRVGPPNQHFETSATLMAETPQALRNWIRKLVE